jgi:hypothetical protein
MADVQTDVRTLERRYRRWLAWYPSSFRREHETELLAVLVAISGDGQRYPAIGEVFALVRSAIGMRLRPDLPRSARALRAAIGLLCLSAVLEIVIFGVMIGTIGNIATRLVVREPGLTEQTARAALVAHLLPELIGAPIVAVGWLVLAWANGHRRRWAPACQLALFVVITVSLLEGLTSGATHYALADVMVGVAVWLTAIVALVLTLRSAARSFA